MLSFVLSDQFPITERSSFKAPSWDLHDQSGSSSSLNRPVGGTQFQANNTQGISERGRIAQTSRASSSRISALTPSSSSHSRIMAASIPTETNLLVSFWRSLLIPKRNAGGTTQQHKIRSRFSPPAKTAWKQQPRKSTGTCRLPSCMIHKLSCRRIPGFGPRVLTFNSRFWRDQNYHNAPKQRHGCSFCKSHTKGLSWLYHSVSLSGRRTRGRI